MDEQDVTPTVDDLLAELAAYVDDDPVPEGWYTMTQIAQEAGVHVNKAKSMMSKRIRQGKVERRTMRGQPYFRVKESRDDG